AQVPAFQPEAPTFAPTAPPPAAVATTEPTAARGELVGTSRPPRPDLIVEYDLADEATVRGLHEYMGLPIVLVDRKQATAWHVDIGRGDVLARVQGPAWRVQPLPEHDDAGRRLVYAQWLDRLRQQHTELHLQEPVLALLLQDDPLGRLTSAELARRCRE